MMTTSEKYYVGRREELAFLLPDTVGRVLEVGCGYGGFRKNITHCSEYWGIEPVDEVAAAAREKLDRVITGTFDEVCDQLPNGYFNLVICNDVIEHMRDHDKFFRDIKAKLSKDGCIVGSIPNVRHVENLIGVLIKRDWHYVDEGILDRTHLRFFTRKSLLATFERHGYRVEDFKGVNSFHFLDARKLKRKIKRFFSFRNFMCFLLGEDTRHLQFAFKIMPAD